MLLFFFNSSVLNYPRSCAGKKKLNSKKNCSVSNYSKKFFSKIQKENSILNYPKSCAGKKIKLKEKMQCFKLFLKNIQKFKRNLGGLNYS